MNNKLSELAQEVGISEEYLRNTKQWTLLEALMRKIVEEYEQLLPEHCPWAGAEEPGPMRGWHVQFVARKHFGVEE